MQVRILKFNQVMYFLLVHSRRCKKENVAMTHENFSSFSCANYQNLLLTRFKMEKSRKRTVSVHNPNNRENRIIGKNLFLYFPSLRIPVAEFKRRI